MRHTWRPGHLILILFAIFSLVSVVGLAPTAAQEGTPAGDCVAPDLQPGTPTPLSDATPDAVGEGEDHDNAATPDSAAESENSPTAEVALPVGTPADAATSNAVSAATANLIACINGGEYQAAAALMSGRFIRDYIDVPTVYDVPATFEGVGPFEVRSLDNVQTYPDGSASIDFVWSGFYAGPNTVVSERWFFVPEDGLLKIDNIIGIPLPADALPGALTVEVTMVDFAFVLDQTTLPADQPLIFRVTNASSGSAHVAVVVTFPEGTTSEEIIDGDEAGEPTGVFGVVYLEPGQSGELGIIGLTPGTYFLVCDVETEAGAPHYNLGMATQFTVE